MLNRRKFIQKTTLLSGVALTASSSSFGILSCKKEKNSTVGHGDFTYEVDKDWGIQDPSQFPVKDCHEMVMDKNQRLIMTTNHKNNNILIYDRSGKILEAWGTEFPGAHGLTIAEEGNEEFLYITDYKTHKVCKTDLKGNILITYNAPPEIPDYETPDQFKPTETTIAPNGDLYIADGYGKDFIIQYDSQGNFVRHFGGRGNGDDQFDCAHGITFDHRDPTNPSLLITSRSANEFKRFSLDGRHLETISLPGCFICRPVLKGNLIYFAVIITNKWDSFDGMLAVLDQNNNVLSMPGGSKPTYKDGVLLPPVYDQKTFLNPHDVCVDNDDNLYVPQWNSNKTYPVKLTRV